MNAPPPVSSGDSALPAIIAGRYRVLRELGRGGMGVVYVVEHVHTGDHLALKALLAHAGADPTAIERFKREARAPARIKSEHVVKITDADVAAELGGAPFFVMELLEGMSLDARLQSGRVSSRETVVLLMQLARVLDKAHGLGIVHRDLKPENIFLHRREDGSFTLKILDFGISKFSSEGAGGIEGAGMTSTGTIMGTPLYMSPEQARGLTAQSGPATDIWAVGLIAFHMLSGAVYWQASTITELVIKLVVEPMVAPSTLDRDLPPGFDAWFMRSCDRDPSQRWANATEQLNALAHTLGFPDLAVTRITDSSSANAVPLLSSAPPSAAAQPSVPVERPATVPSAVTGGPGPAATLLAAPGSPGSRTEASLTRSTESPPARRSKVGLIAAAGTLSLVVAGVGSWVASGHRAGSEPHARPELASSGAAPEKAPSSISSATPATTSAAVLAPSGDGTGVDAPAHLLPLADEHDAGPSASAAALIRPSIRGNVPRPAVPTPASAKPRAASSRPSSVPYDPAAL